MKGIFTLFLVLAILFPSNAQKYDTLVTTHSGKIVKMTAYPIGDYEYFYPKPKPFTFITSIPRTFAESAKVSFGKGSIKGWGIVAGSTALLLALDQPIVDETQRFSKNIGLDADRKYYDILTFDVGGTEINLYQAPGNLNTAIYSIGEGVPPLLIAAGLLTHGLIKNDARSLSTSSQLMQCLISVGITTQLMKRIAGREVPFQATQAGGVWSPLPSFSEFNERKTHYDAFPSGHMATMMATIVVLSENYPEKRWIKPVGYSLMALVGFSMINNGVHWAGDYPLAIGIGYVFGKATVKLNRLVQYNAKRK